MLKYFTSFIFFLFLNYEFALGLENKILIKIDKEKISSPIVKGQNLYVTKNNSIIKLN